ncbi:MAG: DNA double-strand break repair nuclease NurA [Candidatus Baldrarchaeia archaeon]
MSKFNLEKEIELWRSLGKCLSAGDIVLSPFEQPIEEERRGDPDQSDDDTNFGTDNLCISIEPDLKHGKKAIHNINFSKRFKFFLDGSIRTKYIGEYIEGGLAFPIIVSEIAVAVVKKDGNRITPAYLHKKLYFVFPHKDSGFISDSTYNRLEKMQKELDKKDSFTRIEFLKKADIKGDMRNALLGKVRSIMHSLEHEVAVQLPRNENDWLIMDGAIRKHEFLQLKNTIGLAKSFSRKPIFSLSQNKSPITLSAYMRNIRDGERSAVFIQNTPVNPVQKGVMFWYIRLRTYPPMEPLGGIVKVDMKAPEEDTLSAEDIKLIDEISAEIYSMRFPSVYPWPRWPNYIYPIRVAEMYMSSTFLSRFSLSQIGQEMKSMMERGT